MGGGRGGAYANFTGSQSSSRVSIVVRNIYLSGPYGEFRLRRHKFMVLKKKKKKKKKDIPFFSNSPYRFKSHTSV